MIHAHHIVVYVDIESQIYHHINSSTHHTTVMFRAWRLRTTVMIASSDDGYI